MIKMSVAVVAQCVAVVWQCVAVAAMRGSGGNVWQ